MDNLIQRENLKLTGLMARKAMLTDQLEELNKEIRASSGIVAGLQAAQKSLEETPETVEE